MRREAAAYAGVEQNHFGSAIWNFIRVRFWTRRILLVLVSNQEEAAMQQIPSRALSRLSVLVTDHQPAGLGEEGLEVASV